MGHLHKEKDALVFFFHLPSYHRIAANFLMGCGTGILTMVSCLSYVNFSPIHVANLSHRFLSPKYPALRFMRPRWIFVSP